MYLRDTAFAYNYLTFHSCILFSITSVLLILVRELLFLLCCFVLLRKKGNVAYLFHWAF